MAHIIKGDGKAVFGLIITWCGIKDAFSRAGFKRGLHKGACPMCIKNMSPDARRKKAQ